jgi:hypothetical protein
MRRIALFILIVCTTVCYAQKAGDVIAAPSVQQMEKYFAVEELSDELLGRMRGKSLPEEKEKWARETLRYVKVLHVGLDGKTHVGELVCNKLIAQDLRSIFLELYRNKYIIERMVIVDEYGGDDNLSMRHNNTSCFNYRVVPGTNHLSNHGRGLAIDVNPLYNPWVRGNKVDPIEGRPYAFNRAKVKAPVPIITPTDLCYKIFRKHGFTWGGVWRSSKDYQHFEKTK